MTVDRTTVGQTDRKIDRQTHIHTDRSTDSLTDGQAEAAINFR